MKCCCKASHVLNDCWNTDVAIKRKLVVKSMGSAAFMSKPQFYCPIATNGPWIRIAEASVHQCNIFARSKTRLAFSLINPCDGNFPLYAFDLGF